MQYPKVLVNPGKLERFIHVGNGLYSDKNLIESFPNSSHHKWSYESLIKRDCIVEPLVEKITIKKTTIEEYPLVIYEIPSGFPGKKIIITECPYEGMTAKLKNIEEKE